MSAPQLVKFKDALDATEGKDRSLILGNGFSIAQNSNFSYSSLLEKSGLKDTDPARKIFASFKTADFEKVMRALEHAAQVEGIYGDADKQKIFTDDADRVREALIVAVRNTHPGIQYEIPKKEMQTCGELIYKFSKIFTFNYDLLLYWANLNAEKRNHSDGFGLSDEVEGFRAFNKGANCTIYNVHGGLHLFQNPSGETLKRISSGSRIIADIEATIRGRKILPLYVAEGTSPQKLSKINSVPYLRFCLDMLIEQAAPLFIFGSGVNENDEHIYNAIFTGKTPEIYFCVYNPKEHWTAIQENLAKFQVRNRNVKVNYIDASEVSVWR